MSAFGETYFHTNSTQDLNWLIDVLTQARDQRQGVRFYTAGGKLQVKRGGGTWTIPLGGTPDHARDCTLSWQSGPEPKKEWPFND